MEKVVILNVKWLNFHVALILLIVHLHTHFSVNLTLAHLNTSNSSHTHFIMKLSLVYVNTSNSSSSMAFLSVSRALELAPLLGRNFFSTFSPNRPTRKSSSVSYALVGFSRCCLTVLLTNLWSLDAISPRSRIKPRDTLFHIPVNLYTLLSYCTSYSSCGIFSK